MTKMMLIAQVTALCAAVSLTLSAQAALPAAGTISSANDVLDGSRVTANEHRYVIRILDLHPGSVVPGRIYADSCVYNGQRKIFASLSTKATAGATTRAGTIISANVSSTGAVSGFSHRDFPECKEMNGIAVTSDCSTVAALCRRPSSATGSTKDLVASLTNTTWKDWLTANTADDHMWLYEWKNAAVAPLPAAPTNRYVVSKAIGGGWEYGHQNLVLSGSHYGISMKSATGGTTQHQADSFVVVSRTAPAIDTTRGWLWACAEGHTLSNRPAVNPQGAFAALCTTDWHGVASDYTKGGIWMHVENQSKTLVRSIYRSTLSTNRFNGGATSLVALSGGGFLGVFAATDGTTTLPTKIGMVRLNSVGAVVWQKWLRESPGYFLSYPQLVSLGNDNAGAPRFLVGWGRMMQYVNASTFDSPSPNDSQRIASIYSLQEFDANGDAKSELRAVTHGWGEQDQMVSLGKGRAGWIYTPNPAFSTPLPTPTSTSLQWTTYTSTSM